MNKMQMQTVINHNELKINELKAQLGVAMNLINAVAHIGVDCGYGKYKLTDEMIAEARLLSGDYDKQRMS